MDVSSFGKWVCVGMCMYMYVCVCIIRYMQVYAGIQMVVHAVCVHYVQFKSPDTGKVKRKFSMAGICLYEHACALYLHL